MNQFSGSGPLSHITALREKLSISRESPFDRRGMHRGKGRHGAMARAPAGEGTENEDAPPAPDKDHTINITV